MRPAPSFQRIDAAAAEALLERDDLLVLDVRDRKAHLEGCIGEAHMMTHKVLADLMQNAPRELAILVYCHHGRLSLEFAQALSEFGFQEVYSLDGGYEAWRGLGRQTQAPATQAAFHAAFAASAI